MIETLVFLVGGLTGCWLAWVITSIVEIVKTEKEIKEMKLRRKIREEIEKN